VCRLLLSLEHLGSTLSVLKHTQFAEKSSLLLPHTTPPSLPPLLGGRLSTSDIRKLGQGAEDLKGGGAQKHRVAVYECFSSTDNGEGLVL